MNVETEDSVLHPRHGEGYILKVFKTGSVLAKFYSSVNPEVLPLSEVTVTPVALGGEDDTYDSCTAL